MSSKTQFRMKMVLYGLVLVLAELLRSAVFGTLHWAVVPPLMPVAVACISLYEGPQRGSIFGLIGGCIWAWSSQLSYYGAWCIPAMTISAVLAGLIAQRYLLRSIQTAFVVSLPGLLLSEGLYAIVETVSGPLPAWAFFTNFVPDALLALVLCPAFYALTALISRIGGTHG